jgi:hypothetical protein
MGATKINPTSFTTVTLTGNASLTVNVEQNRPQWETGSVKPISTSPIIVNNGTLSKCNTILTECEDRYNDRISCDNDKCFYFPYVAGDKIYIQFQFDRINGSLLTGLMRASNRWKDCNAFVSAAGLSKTVGQTNWDLLKVKAFDECTGEVSAIDLKCCADLFIGVYIDKERSRQLGWTGLDANGLTSDPNKTVWMGYMWLCIDTGKCAMPDKFSLAFKATHFGIDAYVRTEIYEKVKCQEETFQIESEFTYKDCFGYYYGLPYYCHYVFFTHSTNFCLQRAYLSCTGEKARAGTNARYRNVLRLAGDLEAKSHTVRKQNFNYGFGATQSFVNSKYSVIAPSVPEFVAEMIANIHAGKKVYLNGVHVLPSSFEKGSDVTKQWFPELEYETECDTGTFCQDCE